MKKSNTVHCIIIRAKYHWSLFFGDCIRFVVLYDNGFVRSFVVPLHILKCSTSLDKSVAIISFVGLFRRIGQVSISSFLLDDVFNKKKSIFGFLGGK